MRNTMKRILSAAALLAASVAFADTAEIDGRTWTFYVVGKNAAIISATKKSGEMVIPNAFVTSSGTNVVTSIANDAFADDKMTSVTIPTSVTSIGNGAFAGCKGLRSVTIPQCVCESGLWSVFDAENIVKVVVQDGVTEIGSYAFSGCYNLTSVTLPSSLECIGDYAFESCTALTRVKIPNNVGTLGVGIFQDCFALESVTLPSGITKISSSMFAGCYNLASVNIPSTVCEIYDHAFEGCYALSTLKITSDVYAIGDYAFADSGITTLTLPNSVHEVGEGAFSGCLDLATVTITQTILDAGVSTIFDTDLAAAIIIADGAKCIRANAFSGFTYITSVTLPDSVEYIEDRAFYNCRNLVSINLPDEVWRDGYPYEEQIHGIQQIDTEAFCGCESLESIVIPNSAVASCSMGARAFANCYGLKDISVPGNCDISDLFYRDDPDSHPRLWENVTIGWGATSIGGFSNCPNLKTVVYPGTVYDISSQAFKNCTKLESVMVSDEEDENWTPSFNQGKIGEAAFSGCVALTEVDIPEQVTTIGIDAFRDCRSLLSVELPEWTENANGRIVAYGVQSIGNDAFYGCDSLVSINIPGRVWSSEQGYYRGESGVQSIGSMAFRHCGSLTELEIPDSVSTIGGMAFADCYGLKDVTIPLSALHMEFDSDRHMYVVGGLSDVFYFENPERTRAWENVVILDCDRYNSGDGNTYPVEIGEGAFEGLASLKTVELPPSVVSIGANAFRNCAKLESVTLAEGEAYYTTQYTYSGQIGFEAFRGCIALTEVDIPEQVTEIASGAFRDCRSLLSVELPEWTEDANGNRIAEGVQSIGDNAFYGCDSLVSINIPGRAWSSDVGYRHESGVQSIGSMAFYHCSSLTDLEIPDSVSSVGSRAFAYCYGLKDVTLPLSALGMTFDSDRHMWVVGGSSDIFQTDDRSRAWENVVVLDCDRYYNYNRDDGYSGDDGNYLAAIESSAFEGLSNLKTVVLPASVASIGSDAFRNCTMLESVTIADEGEWNYGGETHYNYNGEIGPRAFYGCVALTRVDIPKRVTRIGASAFCECRSLLSVALPESDSVSNGYGVEGVRFIDNSAFCGCSSLASVNLPGRTWNADGYWNDDGVQTICSDAFANCASLTALEIPDSVTGIGEYAFRNCYSLKDVTLPKVAFDSNLWNVFMMDNPERQCPWEKITIGGDVTNIAERVFEGLPNLKTVVLSRSVESIGTRAFANCGKLVDVLIPQGVETIGEEAFAGCSQLLSVTLPSSVTDIGERAFADCGALLDVLFEYDAPAFVGTDVFADVDADCIVWVERGSRGWNVDIPGTWKGVGIHYIPYTSYATCREGLVTTQIANGIRVASANAVQLTQTDIESVKISAMVVSDGTEADTTKGYSVAKSADGLTATFTLKAAEVAMTEEEAQAEKDETDPAGALVTVDESAIEAKPAAKADESVGALPVKETVKGLWYQAAWGNDLNNLTQGEKVQATGDNLYLGVIKQTGDRGFYRISVSEK